MVTNLQQIPIQIQFSKSDLEPLTKFTNSVSFRNKNNARIYYYRLLFFAKFAKEKYGINLKEMIHQTNKNEFNPYDIVNDYCFVLEK